MCENAGAGGWGEGLSTRKYKLDAMMAAGGNLVSSAVFDPKWDNNHVPPFVYDHGENPQYPWLKPLMDYVNRMCHLLSGGIHRANGLLFYTAEGDWAGETARPQEMAALLAQSHVDFDIVPWDLLRGDTLTLREGKLRIHRETFDALVIPFCRYLPEELLRRFDAIAGEAPVIFADALPTVAETGLPFCPENALCMPGEEIPRWFRERGFVDFRLEGCPDLMHLHISHEGTETYFFFNLSVSSPIDETADFPYTGSYTVYDPWDNRCAARSTDSGSIRLRIPPRGTLMLCFGTGLPDSVPGILPGELDSLLWEPIPEATAFQVQLRKGTDAYWAEIPDIPAGQLRNLAPEYPRFSGELLYTARLTTDRRAAFLDLGTVGELAAVTVNGISCGELVSPPFRFRVDHAWKTGENTLEIRIASNPGYFKRDALSCKLSLPPTGLMGPVSLSYL